MVERRDPQRMSPLNHNRLAECKMQELYCSWKGQLLIQDQQLCDIILRSPFTRSIPAQLPTKLDIRHVVAVSELRKKFPEAAFRRNSYTDHEVISEDMLFHLYEVEVLNHKGPNVEQLIEHLKENDLALVKYLNCQRVLVLLASTALLEGQDSIAEEAAHLQALFLISPPEPKCVTANDVRCKHRDNEKSTQVGLVLPSLHQALLEAAKDQGQGSMAPNALVKQHIRTLARQPKTLPPASDGPDCLPLSFELDPESPSDKCPQSSYGHLQFYLSHPQHYMLEMSAAFACLDATSTSPPRDGGMVADDSPGFSLDSLPPEIPTDTARASLRPRCVAAQAKSACNEAAVKPSLLGDHRLQQCKRRSSRLLGASARKKWTPLKVLSLMDNSKKQNQNVTKDKPPSSLPLKRSLSAPPLGNSLGATADFSEPTLKLKNIQSPLRRKRGAQVLSAEFVRETRNESAPKALFLSESLDPSGKKPRLLRCRRDGEKLRITDQVDIRRPVTRSSTLQSARETSAGSPTEAGDENKPWAESTAAAPDVGSALHQEECDSHALNMLADLALSCNSPLMSNGSQSPPVGTSPTQEHRRIPKGKTSCKSVDHEYHQGMQNWKGGSLSGSRGRASLSPPGQSGFGPERPSIFQERDPWRTRGSRNPRPASAKSPAVSPKETGELADPSVHALISSEHSYASPSRRGTLGALDPRNGVEHGKAEPLAMPGKVLPFRHQQHLCPPHKLLKSYVPFPRSTIMAKRLKEDTSKFRQVTFCDRTVKVTFRWEAEYLFSLDSKYTCHPLEKTVVRAVHGPWDVGLPNSVDEMKLIIHMWVALFYSKPFKSPLARTVVEHSNPAKYVSLNSTLDSFEFVDDFEGPCSLEKCPTDSLSETPRTPGEVTERASSPSEKPLSCNEPSSTNCIEDEPTLTGTDEPSGWVWEEDQFPAAACNSSDGSASFSQEADQELEEELPSPMSVDSPNRNSSLGQSARHAGPQTPGDSAEAEAKRAANIPGTSQKEAVAVTAGFPENSAAVQPVAGPEASPVEKNREIDRASLPPEEKEHKLPGAGAETLPASSARWIEADATSRAEDVRERLPRDEEEASEESTTWESIDLALSESNDTDVEPQDMDLGQEEEELPEDTVTEEREADAALPNEGLMTLAASWPEFPAAPKVSALPASTPPSLSPVALVEDSRLLQEDGGGSLVGPVSQQADLMRHDEEAKSAEVEGTQSSVCPKQMVVDKDFRISKEDAAVRLTDSSPKQPEVLQVQKDVELIQSQESCVLPKNPVGLADLSLVSREEKDLCHTDSIKRPASPVCCAALSDGVDLPGNQGTFAVAAEHHAPLNPMDWIEDISQDGAEWAGADTLQNCESCQVQSESVGNGEDVLVSAPNLASTGFISGPSVLQEEGGTPLADPVELLSAPVHQAPDEIKERLRNRDASIMTAEDVTLPDQVDFDGDSRGSLFPEAAPLPVGDFLQIQHTTFVPDGQGSSPMQLMSSSSKGESSPCVEEDDREIESDSENQRHCVEKENVGASSQAVVPGGKRDQVVGTEPEGTGSRRTVNATNAGSEGTSAKENSTLTWISSVNLESVTPPESDEDTPASSQLPHANTKWVVSEYLQQCHVVADHKIAPSEAQAASLSALHETTKCNQMEVVEKKTPLEKEATSTIAEVFPGYLGALWVDVGRSSGEHTLPSAKSSVPSENTSLDKSATSELCGVDMEQADHEAFEKEAYTTEMIPEILSHSTTERQCEYASEEVGTLPPGDTRESLGDPEDARSSERRTALDQEKGSSFVGNGREVVGDAYPSKSRGLSRPLGEVDITDCVCDLSLNKEISESGGRRYPEEKERMVDAAMEATKCDDRSGTPSLDDSHQPGLFRGYINFSVTKKQKEKMRSFHSSVQPERGARVMGSVRSWNQAVGLWNDPTQNNLDMACLRFHCKVKQILKKSQRSTSTAPFTKGFPPEVMTKPLPLRAVPGAPALNPPSRCRSPLLITVRNLDRRLTASSHYPRSSRHVDSFEPLPLPSLPPFVSTQESLSKAARCAKQGPEPVPSFHLNKLTYSNKLKDFRGDISAIMDEFAELSTVIALDGRPRSPQGRAPLTTSEEEAVQERVPVPLQRTPVYEHLFAELCNTLHFRLKSVVQQACKKPYAFYLIETDDDPCFGRLKNLLKKGGHAEMEPLYFCNTSHVETDRLMVIIRNEDIFSHIHKIPCLLRLKHFPSVTFAGVDNPEDMVDHTYQELFHRGGFVVSDESTLEAMTVGELKEILKTLEKLQGHGRWRWLLHYKEVKQLREKSRVDPAAHTKESLLKSCQGANLTEVLHYHPCDSRASPKSEQLSCVLKLQVQHISERFAVFLTDKPSSSQEALEGKGILVVDVPTFLEKAEGLATLCRSSCW